MAKPANSPQGNMAGRVMNWGMTFLKHGRLAALLMLFSLAAGLTYYVYAKPVYYSKSLVKFNIIDLPINERSGSADEIPHYRLKRALLVDLQQPYLIERTAVRLGLVESTGTIATIRENYVKEVRVDELDAHKLKIEVSPYSAELAMVFAEAMVAEYQDYHSQLRNEYREQAVETYTRELAEVRKKREENLAARKRQEQEVGITNVSIKAAESNQIISDIILVDRQIGLAEPVERYLERDFEPLEVIARLAYFNSEIRAARSPDIARRESTKGTITVLPSRTETVFIDEGAATTSQWQNLLSSREKLKARKTQESKTYGPGSPTIKAIDSEIAILEQQIESQAINAKLNFRTQYTRLQERKTELEEKLPEGLDAVAELARKQQNLDMMDSELAWDKAYDTLKGKLESLDFGAGKERIHLHYERLDQVRDTPVSPNKMKLVYAALALGLALAAGVPMALEHFNDTASKIDELERALNLKGLGVVPVTPKGDLEDIVRSPEVDARIPNSLLENFRVIRSGIALNNENENSQVIMLTSARASEGKTVNSCNLGWAFASLNEPTLLIDSDLRRGRIHNVLDIPNEIGLSNVLMGEATIEEAIQQTKVPNLYALTRGPIIPGSTERLCIPEYEAQVQDLRTRFARIIMDSPPVLGLSETSSLMRLVDGVVLVIRAERTTQRDVQSAATTLRKAGANFYGFVLNRLDLNRISNYYNYYYYSSYYYDQLIDEAATEKKGKRRSSQQPRNERRPKPQREPRDRQDRRGHRSNEDLADLDLDGRRSSEPKERQPLSKRAKEQPDDPKVPY